MTPAQVHRQNVEGGLAPDPAQFALADKLTDLQQRLIADGAGRPRRGRRLRGLWRSRSVAPQRGLYIWGGVGRGKTYLMDVFHETLPFAEKERLHFHRFMQRVHEELRTLAGRRDPLRVVAERFAERTRVLCFDEFFVSDIGDAMILGGLLQALFERGVCLVATSNVEPRKLYENGLQRRRFLPAIALVERHTEVLHVGGDADYRLQVLRRDGVYRVDVADDALLASFHAVCHARPQEDVELVVNERPITARCCAEDTVLFDFEALCDGPRALADYVELARLFATVFVRGVPVFDAANEDQARRFIGLVDEFYDRNVKLLLGAAAPVDALYQGQRLGAEFERTKSRLTEMQSPAYLSRTHRP